MKKYVTTLLTLAMLITCFFSFGLTVNAAWQDTITAEAPALVDGYYEISKPEHFMWIKNNNTLSYKLITDIQIGTKGNPFTAPFEFNGTLIGDDPINLKTITMYISTSTANTGLFSNSTTFVHVENIRLKGSVTSTKEYTGGLYGLCSLPDAADANSQYDIKNCVNEADITGTTQVGGLIGRAYGGAMTRLILSNIINKGTVKTTSGENAGGIAGTSATKMINCANIGKVEAKTNGAGGICGWSLGDKISGCYNASTVTADANAGGIVGKAQGSGLVIENCYNAGEINSQYAAGIACWPQVAASIKNCYNVGAVSGTSALPIYSRENNTIVFSATGCYYLGASDTDGKANTTNFTSTDGNTLSAWSFDTSIWNLNHLAEYPYPQLEGWPLLYGVKLNPYLITDAEGFFAIENEPAAYYKLKNEISLGDYTPFAFSGTLYADALTPISVAINKNSLTNVGLFSMIENGVYIENIKVAGSVYGNTQVGGFAGLAQNVITGATIKNCVNDAEITAETTQAGGFIGRAFNCANLKLEGLTNQKKIWAKTSAAGGICGLNGANILTSKNEGIISADNMLGGLAGWNTGGSISKSYNAGIVTGNEKAGGLIGTMQYNSITISDSYNCGEVSAISRGTVGGIIGNVLTGLTLTLKSSYNVGTISGATNSGAFCGLKEGTVTIPTDNKSYYLDINGLEDADVYSLDLTQMKGAKSLLGSNFSIPSVNYGFPQITENTNYSDFNIFEVSITPSGSGTLNPTGSFYYQKGKILTVNAIPEDGYYLEAVESNNGALPFVNLQFSTTIIGNTTITVTFAVIPEKVVAEIEEEFAQIAVQCMVPLITVAESIPNQDGTFEINPEETYAVSMATAKEFNGWTLVDYGVKAEGIDYTAKPYIKSNKFGVLFYGSKIKAGNTIKVTPYGVYKNNTTDEEITVYGEAYDYTIE